MIKLKAVGIKQFVPPFVVVLVGPTVLEARGWAAPEIDILPFVTEEGICGAVDCSTLVSTESVALGVADIATVEVTREVVSDDDIVLDGRTDVGISALIALELIVIWAMQLTTQTSSTTIPVFHAILKTVYDPSLTTEARTSPVAIYF